MAKKRKIAFVGSECYPFVKTGGLGDVMYALPRALVGEECEVRVILPLYACIPQKFKDQMKHKGSFMMDLTLEGRTFFVGIMELEMDGGKTLYSFALASPDGDFTLTDGNGAARTFSPVPY